MVVVRYVRGTDAMRVDWIVGSYLLHLIKNNVTQVSVRAYVCIMLSSSLDLRGNSKSKRKS